jgi:hypothetical protein
MKTIDINDYETRMALGAMTTEELRAINNYVVGILKTRKASKLAKVKQELMEGARVIVNHPQLSFRNNLVLTKINKTRGVVQVQGATGRFDQGWNVPLQLIEMQ